VNGGWLKSAAILVALLIHALCLSRAEGRFPLLLCGAPRGSGFSPGMGL
jgi:hypothetical protein